MIDKEIAPADLPVHKYLKNGERKIECTDLIND